jgi:nucleoside-diphosphate-sugar epimerase
MTVLVTGSTGFIGRHLVSRLLGLGCVVHCVTRQRELVNSYAGASNQIWHWHDGSMTKIIGILEKSKPDLVIHLAALFVSQHNSEDINSLIDSNLLFGTQVMEAMNLTGVRLFINTGTSWQNYKNSDYSPVNLYAATKQAFEDVALYYCEARRFSMITLRLCDTYGPEDTRPKLMPLLKRASQTGERIELSPGLQILDLVYIDDIVDGFIIACEQMVSREVIGQETYRLSSGEAISLRDLVELVNAITKTPLNIAWGSRPYREREVMAPVVAKAPLPGWRPRKSIDEGLRIFLEN